MYDSDHTVPKQLTSGNIPSEDSSIAVGQAPTLLSSELIYQEAQFSLDLILVGIRADNLDLPSLHNELCAELCMFTMLLSEGAF